MRSAALQANLARQQAEPEKQQAEAIALLGYC